MIGLSAALVARVSGHLHHGLDLGGTDHDTADAQQLSDALGLHVTDGRGFGLGRVLEVDLIPGTDYLISRLFCTKII